MPVLYQQDRLELQFAEASSVSTGPQSDAPAEWAGEDNPYGFIGRDGAILELERALHRPPPALLVHGLGGVGKTTLARGFAQWLVDTEGLAPERVFWFRFDEIQSAEYVVNRIVERLFGVHATSAAMDQKLEALRQAFHQVRCLVVWDNFEVVFGIPDALAPSLSPEDQDVLRRLLKGLRGSPTKVLITSRSEEDALGKSLRYKVPLGGLQGEERWEYCQAILDDLGLTVDRENPDLKELIDALQGHPLAMRALLPQLEDLSPRGVLTRLGQGTTDATDGGEAEVRLFSALRVAVESIPEDAAAAA